MDISLRIQTPTNQGYSGQTCGSAPSTCETPKSTSLSDSLPSTTTASNDLSQLSKPDSLGNIVINNNINSDCHLPKDPGVKDPKTQEPPTSTAPTKDDWVKTFMGEIKTMFDGFLSSMTKLLETFLGKKTEVAPSSTATTSTPTSTSSVSQSTTTQPASTQSVNSTSQSAPMETFSQRTAKNMGNQSKSKVSEESMREYVLMYQIYQKDQESEGIFKASLSKHKEAGLNSDDAIKKSLIDLESSGRLQRWESDWIYSLSAKASQFDNNKEISKSQAFMGDVAIKTVESNLVRIATGADVPEKLQIS